MNINLGTAIAAVSARLPALHDDWRAILLKAWSVRFAVAGAVVSGLQGAFYFLDLTFLPQWAFLAIVIALFVVAPVARVLVQPNLTPGAPHAD